MIRLVAPFAALIAALLAVHGCGGSPAPAPLGVPKPPPVDVVTTPPPPPSQPQPQPPADQLALWPKVIHGRLPNGLTYYVLPNKRPDKRAMLWLAVNAGSVQEDDDQRGLAHFVEHMAFNGTKRFAGNEIIQFIEKSGLHFGADANAYTSWDETVYQLEVPTDDPTIFDRGLDVLRDWSADVVFDPKEVEAERGVVLEEWRLGLGASRRLFDKHVKVIYAGSRYADRITIGLAETIKGAPRDAVVRYYKDWYRPDLMAVIVVGDIGDATAVERQIVSKFGDLKAPATPRPRPRGELPTAPGTRVSIETDGEQPVTNVAISNQVAHRPERNRGDLKRTLIESAYVQMLNERLRTIARHADAPFTGGGATIGSPTREIDSFSRSATVKNGRVEDALRALATEIARIEQHGFTQSELDRARAILISNAEQQMADATTHPSRPFAEELVRNFFEHEFVVGPLAEAKLNLEILPTITLADVAHATASFGGPDHRVVTISGPPTAKLPTRDRALALIDEATRTKLEPWVDKPPPSTIIPPPTPGKIVKETTDDKHAITTWTLSNGARVLIKTTDFDADLILLSATSPGGLATASNADYIHARFADAIIPIGGIGQLDAEDLGKLLAGKQVGVAVSIGEVTESLNARSSKRDLETMLQLVHGRMTAPRKDDAQIAVWRENNIQSYTDRERNPEFKFNRAFNDLMWKDHPRRASITPAYLKRVDADRAFTFYKDRFADATDFTFAIVGAIDVAKLRPLVETYLASLPAKGRRERERDGGARRHSGAVKKTWEFGKEPKARVTLVNHAEYPWTRDNERDMYILSRVLGIKLREELREKAGGVYGVSAGGYLLRSPHPERGFTISFGADPARVDELIKKADATITEIVNKGVDEETLDKLRKGLERDRELQLRQNSFWIGVLDNHARFGDDPEISLDTKPVIARMTSPLVQAAAKRYLGDRRNYFQAVMMPEGSSTGTPPHAGAAKKPPAKDPKVVPGAERDPKTVPGVEKQ